MTILTFVSIVSFKLQLERMAGHGRQGHAREAELSDQLEWEQGRLTEYRIGPARWRTPSSRCCVN